MVDENGAARDSSPGDAQENSSFTFEGTSMSGPAEGYDEPEFDVDKLPMTYAALKCIERDWAVHPGHAITKHDRCTCLAGGQAPCASAGKHPIDDDWPNVSSTDQETVTDMFAKYENEHRPVNIGIQTGKISGFWVFDVDTDNGKQGAASLALLESRVGEMPDTYTVITGGGGTQLYFKIPPGKTVKNSNPKLTLGPDYPHIDVKGECGQVVAPPSVSGKGLYLTVDDRDPVEAPEGLLKIMEKRGLLVDENDVKAEQNGHREDPVTITPSKAPYWVADSVNAKIDAVRNAPDGHGNETINSMSFQLGQYIPHGWVDEDDVRQRLTEAAASWAHQHPRAAFTINHGITDGKAKPYESTAALASAGKLSDAILAERFASEIMHGRFRLVAGLGWVSWNGKIWEPSDEPMVVEAVRQHVVKLVQEALPAVATNGPARTALLALFGRNKIRAVVDLMRGNDCVHAKASDFDAHPHLLNTPAGVVDMRTGDVQKHAPALLLTKITKGSYRPGYAHPDWDKALEALPEDVRGWFQVMTGQAATGETTPGGVLVLLQGSGENGKTVCTTDGPVPALGDYADMASAKLFASKSTEHSTEIADLRAQRLLIGEELTEGRSLNITAIKRFQDVGRIKARYAHKDNFTFIASHSLMITSNYIPSVSESDHGTWRRLVMLRFPYRFTKPWESPESPNDRRGDPTLKQRIKADKSGQFDAIVTWVVEGAIRAYADPNAFEPPKQVAEDTLAWRKSSDRIMGFWDEHLVADRNAGIWKPNLLAQMNWWLGVNGHHAWPKETFGPRFGQHSESARHGVETRRPTDPTGIDLSRIEDPNRLPAQPEVWWGVRFKTDAELDG